MSDSRLKARTGLTLLVLGIAAYLVGAWQHGLPWAGHADASLDTFWALLLAAVLIAVLSLVTGRLDARRGFALAVAAVWLAAGGVVEILGPLAVLGGGAVLATLLPVAGMPVLVRVVAGLGLVAALVGWPLPFPVHHQLTWVPLLAAGIVWRRKPLLAMWHELRRDGRESLRDSRAAFWLLGPVLLVVMAPALMPRLGSDDLSYHLIIPGELLAYGHSRLDAGTQVWTFGPWSLDLLHGLAWVFGGDQPTTAGMNVFWLLAACALCARIAREQGLGHGAAWLAAAVFASIPMVTQLAGTLQVEAASPAILAALYLAVSRAREPGALVVVAALAGLLMGSKISNALLALPLAAWLLWQLRGAWPRPRTWIIAVALGAFAGGSSYFWGAVLAGNPVLPLFNGVFGSPYFLQENWHDASWQLEWGPGLPWAVVFDTGRYLSAKAGAMGAVWLVLAGALPLALADARTRPTLLIGLAGLLLVFSQVQFLRYVLPALVLIVPALFAAATRLAPRTGVATGMALVLLQVLLIPSASWVFAGRSLKLAVTEGHDAVIARFASEQHLAATFEAIAEPGDRLLFTDRTRAYVGTVPGQSNNVAWYDFQMSSIFRKGGGYGSAEAWKLALETSGANYLVVSHGQARDGLGELMASHQAELVAHSSTSSLFRLYLDQPLPIEATDTGVTGKATPSLTGPTLGSAWLDLACDQPGKPIAVGWTLHSKGEEPARQWGWLSCGYDGKARARIGIRSLAPVQRIDVVAQPAPPSEGMQVRGLGARLDLRNDPLPTRSPVLRNAGVFCPRFIKSCRRPWASIEPLP